MDPLTALGLAIGLIGKIGSIALDASSNREADREAAIASLQRLDAAADAELAAGAARRAKYKAEEQAAVDAYEKGQES